MKQLKGFKQGALASRLDVALRTLSCRRNLEASILWHMDMLDSMWDSCSYITVQEG